MTTIRHAGEMGATAVAAVVGMFAATMLAKFTADLVIAAGELVMR